MGGDGRGRVRDRRPARHGQDRLTAHGFCEYYDLRADPSRLTNRVHGASAEQERRPGVPAARQLTAARAT
ncbi:hypothetical protein ACFTY8_31205 [Streptomyces mirabilis]|uniref:hypothetical protein n=1 Tax=Streptomyces mirabilis TaxID=68239 RepID=UPI003643974D